MNQRAPRFHRSDLTYEEVEAAAKRCLAEGEMPTQRRMMALLEGGGPATIAAYLRQFYRSLAGEEATTTIPATLQGAVANLYQQIRAQVQDELVAAREAVVALKASSEMESKEWSVREAELMEQITTQGAALSRASEEELRIKEDLQGARSEVNRLEASTQILKESLVAAERTITSWVKKWEDETKLNVDARQKLTLELGALRTRAQTDADLARRKLQDLHSALAAKTDELRVEQTRSVGIINQLRAAETQVAVLQSQVISYQQQAEKLSASSETTGRFMKGRKVNLSRRPGSKPL